MSAVRDDLPGPAGPAAPAPAIGPLGVESLDEVLVIETAAYAFPWSRGNFIDSLAAGYLLRGRRAPGGPLLGYYVAMDGFEEMHLLNLTVAPAHEGEGHARALLADLYAAAATHGARSLWLEVRESNARARTLYLRQGFTEAGRRRQYYPAVGGREDAILMSRPLPAAGGPGGVV